MDEKFQVAQRYSGIGESIWDETFDMVEKNKPVNLGSGYPNFSAQPETLKKALSDVCFSADHRVNQYTRGTGHPRFVNILAKLYSKLLNRDIAADTEILVTIGADEAIYCSLMGLINTGDEVMIIEPFFDAYIPMVKVAGGVPVSVPLRYRKVFDQNTSKNWVLDQNELESAFSTRTKIILVNTPHNPTGKVFTKSELEMIANLCKKYNVIALMDEVYEWIVYDDSEHIRMACLPEMFDRCITVGSIGKSFSVTGWKLGFAITSAALRKALCLAHQTSNYVCPTNIQEAAAIAYEIEYESMFSSSSSTNTTTYWSELSAMLQTKRDFMAKILGSLSITAIIPDGSYFMIADISELIKSIDLSGDYDDRGEDMAFVKWLSRNKLQAIPLSVFYSQQYKSIGKSLIRFCYFKRDETLRNAETVLIELKNKLSL